MEDIIGLKAKLDTINAAVDITGTALDVTQQSLTSTKAALLAEITALKDRISKLEIPGATGPGATGATGPSVWVSKFPGDTKSGNIRWGCSFQSNAIPVSHETATGVTVGVRRTFWDMNKTSSLLSNVKTDHNAGRVPYVSVKLGTSWKNVAAGTIDAALIKLFADLKATGKTVWFTAHHEPEGGNGTPYPDDGQGTEPDWRNMQVHIRELIDASGAKNIAFASTLMAWTFDSRSGRNPADWWVDGIWDFAGLDHYVEANSATVQTAMWNNALAFYKSKGLKVALGEWGNKDHGTTGAAEMQAWYDHLRSVGAIGACYFDTSQNGGVPLSGDALVKFRELMKVPTSISLEKA
jgi:hypothetical protein